MSNSYYIVSDNMNNILNANKEFPFVQYDNEYKFHEGWQFEKINLKNYFKFPWLKGMSAAIRVSKIFLKYIDIFAIQNKTLIFDEILYPTIALHNNLLMINPIELSSIVFKCDYNNIDTITNYLYWNFNDIREDYLLHPIKDLKLQNDLRLIHRFL